MAEPRRVAAVAYDMLASKLGSEGIVTAADKAVLELLEDEEGAAACATELEDGKVDAEAADPLAALGVAGAWRRRLFACCELTAAANLGCRGDGILYVGMQVVVIHSMEGCETTSLLTFGSQKAAPTTTRAATPGLALSVEVGKMA